MIDFAQSNLVALIAGSIIATTVFAAAGWQASESSDLASRSALDALAADIGASDCSALHPAARLNLSLALRPLGGSVISVLLVSDHLRALRKGGVTVTSVEFPTLHLRAPLELLGAASLELSYDAFEERCTARVA